MPKTTEILPPRYRGAQPIGKGGMGEIYRATDSTLGRAVAVKMLAARFAEDAQRLAVEVGTPEAAADALDAALAHWGPDDFDHKRFVHQRRGSPSGLGHLLSLIHI